MSVKTPVDCAEFESGYPAPDKCKCPKGCVVDCAGCRYNWEENDKEELGFI